MLFDPKQVQKSAIISKTFTEQGDRKYSNVELNSFWSQVFSTERSDATLKPLGEAILFDFLAQSGKHSTDFLSKSNRDRLNCHNVFAPLFAPDLFAD